MNFRFIEDTEATKADNNGHVVHRVELHVEGETSRSNAFYGDEVGYINVTYVPSDVWRERYTGDWGMVRWLNDFTGACGFTDCEHVTDENGDITAVNEWLHKDLEKTVRTLSKYLDRRSEQLSKSDVEEMSEEALEAAFEHYTDKIREEHGEDYDAAREFHVGKPRVEFIRVAREHRRKGYGTALYRRMTEELDRRFGFKLYDGGIQSDEAEAVWEKLVTLDWNKAQEVEYPHDHKDRTRYKLSFNPQTPVKS